MLLWISGVLVGLIILILLLRTREIQRRRRHLQGTEKVAVPSSDLNTNLAKHEEVAARGYADCLAPEESLGATGDGDSTATDTVSIAALDLEPPFLKGAYHLGTVRTYFGEVGYVQISSGPWLRCRRPGRSWHSALDPGTRIVVSPAEGT